jgi:hypothetical protein
MSYGDVKELSPVENVWTSHNIFTDDKDQKFGFGDYQKIAIDAASAMTFSDD